MTSIQIEAKFIFADSRQCLQQANHVKLLSVSSEARSPKRVLLTSSYLISASTMYPRCIYCPCESNKVIYTKCASIIKFSNFSETYLEQVCNLPICKFYVIHIHHSDSGGTSLNHNRTTDPQKKKGILSNINQSALPHHRYPQSQVIRTTAAAQRLLWTLLPNINLSLLPPHFK